MRVVSRTLVLASLSLSGWPDNPVNHIQIASEQRLTNNPRVGASYARLPLSFEANRGQTDRRVKFLSRGDGYTVFLTANEAVLVLQKPSALGKEIDRAVSPQSVDHLRAKSAVRRNASVLRMKLVGARAATKVFGLEELSGKSNYFIGNDPKKWHAQVPTYAKIRYEEAYSGIDLIYYGHQRQLEYDFVVAPGADPRAIRFRLDGVHKMRIDGNGDLVLPAGEDEIRLLKPVVYQTRSESGSTRDIIEGRYVLKGAREVAFELGVYDSTRPLIIDPVLTYSTYLGGNQVEWGSGIAVDGAGNAYVTGVTLSTDFPTVNPLQPNQGGDRDAFVTAFDPTGSTLIYSTYVGGSRSDGGQGIAADSEGNAYLVGATYSTDFPTANPLQPTFHGTRDAIVAKIDPTGSTLIYSTYLGGSNEDFGAGIAVDSAGNAYVTGFTYSTDFPTVNPLQPTNQGLGDIFVAEIDPTGSTLIYSTYLGGSNDDTGTGIAVDGAGSAYITGRTASLSDFPLANPFQSTNHGGNLAAFVAKIAPDSPGGAAPPSVRK